MQGDKRVFIDYGSPNPLDEEIYWHLVDYDRFHQEGGAIGVEIPLFKNFSLRSGLEFVHMGSRAVWEGEVYNNSGTVDSKESVFDRRFLNIPVTISYRLGGLFNNRFESFVFAGSDLYMVLINVHDKTTRNDSVKQHNEYYSKPRFRMLAGVELDYNIMNSISVYGAGRASYGFKGHTSNSIFWTASLGLKFRLK